MAEHYRLAHPQSMKKRHFSRSAGEKPSGAIRDHKFESREAHKVYKSEGRNFCPYCGKGLN